MKKTVRRRDSFDISILNNDLHPSLRHIYVSRGIKSNAELARELDNLLPYHSLSGINQAVVCLANAIFLQQKILIVGDFDADGATSTAVAIRALKSFGAKNINYLVPNRFTFGYGLTAELINIAKDMHPDIIVTVDNGISSHAGVEAAKALGIKVVITDHHLASDSLPMADAIVNPNQSGDLFPSKNLAGVGVIFYVMLALRNYLLEQNWFQQQNIPNPNLSKLLDLVALGTVADVVPLDHNNRILVYQGLRRIRAGHCVPGIVALLEISNRSINQLQATDLGFAVGPRLNAAGRLEDMSIGIECLLADDLIHARALAEKLNFLNDDRRIIEQDMQTQAFAALKKIDPKPTNATLGVCLFDKDWHQGVIGILASRIKDHLHLPVIAFAMANNAEIKGSARSIPGLHIRDVLADIATKYPALLSKFGGHAMAAGLTLAHDAFHKFSAAFNEIVTTKLQHIDLQNILLSDGELQQNEISLEFAEIIRAAGPWGQAFPEPLFDGIFQILEQRIVGGKHLKMTLGLGQEPKIIPAIAFNIDLEKWPNHRCENINIAYRLDINEFRGKRNLQFIVENMEAV